MTKPVTNLPSLIERAAQVYDFEAFTRPRSTVAEVPCPPDDRPARRQSIDRVALAEAGFVLPDAPVTALAEEFRIVKRQLLLKAAAADADPRQRMILIASAQPDEGKSFCAVNLALSIANERDHEVLLVDADVARPSIPAMLGLTAGPGLIDAIADADIDPESCVIRTDLATLSVLPAGRASNQATELLAAERTRIVLERLAGAAPNRIVIFDSPPVLAASPASELAHHVGQTVLVVRADRTGAAALAETAALLAGCPDIRLLLNGVRLAARGHRFGSYYGYGGQDAA